MAWNFDTMKEALSEMEKDDYQEFIKAFLSLELSISDRTILNQVYQDYMDEDDLSLISDELRVKVDGYLDEVQADMTDILEKLYRTGEGSSFIMDLMSSNIFQTPWNSTRFWIVTIIHHLALKPYRP